MQGTGLINSGTPIAEQARGFARAAEVADDGNLPIVVRTVLNLSRDTIAYWQNMTCFFNKWWFPEPDRITLPFCFFHVVRYSETEIADTSQKRVIMYELPEEIGGQVLDLQDPVRLGLMQTIVDNVVIQPMEIKMDVIVPFMPFGRFVIQGVELARWATETMAFFGKDNSISPSAIEYIAYQFKDIYGVTGTATKAQLAYADQKGVMEDSVHGMNSADGMINKNSLDVMFRRGHILQLKTWMGFDYKYVVIVSKTAEKRSTEDDVWRVSLTLRELPILSLTPVRGAISRVDRTWVLGSINKLGSVVGVTKISSQMPYYQAISALGGGINDNNIE